eukprot:TRINITY_DN17015_c0_g1_i1.p1 TRINITY_DN17015_c0_g1~~TRINITY_DN17015_c0_g1_i1.p1  ORF type:complete len:441 (+),score=72.15 TRINITY_DN17015_c0_g1_i1:58-1380(+)
MGGKKNSQPDPKILITCQKGWLQTTKRNGNTVIANQGDIEEDKIPVVLRAQGCHINGGYESFKRREKGREHIQVPWHMSQDTISGTTSQLDWDWISAHLYNEPRLRSADSQQSSPPAPRWSHVHNVASFKTAKTVQNLRSLRSTIAWFSLLALDALLAYCLHTLMSSVDNSSLSALSDQRRSSAESMQWIMGWPAGFKGNTQLNKSLGKAGMWVLSWEWIEDWVHYAASCLTHTGVLNNIGVWMVLGGTGVVGIGCDIATVLSMPFIVGFLGYGLVFNTVKEVLVQLAGMMRGKKFNPLRKKLDCAPFDSHQKLMCTVLFTLVVFLFPTIAVYYLFFSFSYLALRACQELLTFLSHLLLTLPILAVLLHPFSPPLDRSWTVSLQSVTSEQTVLKLTRKPLPIGDIFEECGDMCKHWITQGPLRTLKASLSNGHLAQVTGW